MIKTKAYSAQNANSKLAQAEIERRHAGEHDVEIDILYCGVCHSDVHQARGEWGNSIFPMTPGHEIVGKVTKVGSKVTKFKAGDSVGVGCMTGSCRSCEECESFEEQFCDKVSFTYNGVEIDGKTPTHGGYSTNITVDENYVLKIPANLPLDAAAPLLCAGITTYSPLHHYGVKKGDNIAVVGLGGLGHMGVKIAKAMGAKVTVLSHSKGKENDAKRLGADDFILTSKPDAFTKNAGKFSFILNTISAKHDYNSYLNLLKRDGTMVLVGIPDPSEIHAFSLVGKRRRLGGSLIGGIKETQEMLDFCAKHNVVSDIETIKMQEINEAYERMVKGDVKYRFVIDMASLKS